MGYHRTKRDLVSLRKKRQENIRTAVFIRLALAFIIAMMAGRGSVNVLTVGSRETADYIDPPRLVVAVDINPRKGKQIQGD